MERLRALVESDVLAVDRGRRVAWGGPADGATLRGAGREKFWQRMATPHLLDRSEPPTEFSAASVSGGRAAGALRAGGSSFGTHFFSHCHPLMRACALTHGITLSPISARTWWCC